LTAVSTEFAFPAAARSGISARKIVAATGFFRAGLMIKWAKASRQTDNG
jgi:hypothetical protein